MKPFDLLAYARPHLQKMTPYSSARDEFTGQASALLDANENPFPSDWNRYPDPSHQDLREAAAAYRGVTPANILAGNGSDEILDLIYRAFCRPGIDAIATLTPSYGMYRVLADLNDLHLIDVPLQPDGQMNPDALLQAAKNANARLIQLCSPNNPTGNLLRRNDLLQVLEQFDGPVVIDEAYIDFAGERSLVDDLTAYGQLIITQTLSKAFGLAGVRVGLAFASEEIIQLLYKIKPPYNLSRKSQRIATERFLEADKVHAEVQAILAERDRVRRALEAHESILHVYPSDANFLLVQVENAFGLMDFLARRGVIVRHRSFEPHFVECLRVTIGTEEENDLFLAGLDAYLCSTERM